MRTILLVCLFAASAHACLWDDDTLLDEKRGLPGMAAILASKYERHSALYYEKRIERARERIAKDAKDARAHDNLIAALDRLGRYKEALQAALAKEQVLPGEYTTHANLGTVYYHLGDLQESVLAIERALKINPEAHFGREAYQLELVKLIRSGRKLSEFDDVAASLKGDAIEAITGIIRFSDPRSPELWYVLGTLLEGRGDLHFASRAFRRAQEAGYPDAADVTRRIERAESKITVPGDTGAAVFAAERAEGREWAVAYQEFEDGLIRAGTFPESDEDYAPFYARWGHRDHEPLWRWTFALVRKYARKPWAWAVAALGAYILFRTRRRSKSV